MSELELSAKLDELNEAQRQIASAAIDWGYGKSGINRRRALWEGRRILDIGMGGGPHCIPFLLGGASGYIGVDPLVGSDRVRDLRSNSDPSLPPYHAFPYNPDEMMEAFPGLHLYSSIVEEAADQIREHQPELIILSSVTEHLRDLEGVMRAAHNVSAPNAAIWMAHANYYSWTGHHRPPRTVDSFIRGEPDPDNVSDWQHLNPDHHCYNNVNLNRVRLHDFHDVVDKYFRIIEWRVSIDAMDRLTKELREKWKKYTLEELLARTVFVCGVRREEPLNTDFSERPLHHPGESYLADNDYSNEEMEPFRQSNLVYFDDQGRILSHGYNDGQGGRIMGNLRTGDHIVLKKFPREMRCTVKEVKKLANGVGWVRVDGNVPEDITENDDTDWTIAETVRHYGPEAKVRENRESIVVRSVYDDGVA